MKRFSFLIFLIFPIVIFSQIVVLKVEPANLKVLSGELRLLEFEIKNGSKDLLSTGKNYFLSYHLYDRQGKLISLENRRWSLPVVIFPGRTVTFRRPVFFNHPPGNYRLQWELLHEGSFWGKERGWQPVAQEVVINDLFGQQPVLKKRVFQADDDEFADFELLVQQTLKNSAFFLRPGLLAFAAGSDYPQFWVRDFASLITVAAEYYMPEQIEQLLQFLISSFIQHGPADWYDASGKSDLNSVASDQEPSLILAAGEYFRRNPQWISKNEEGKLIPEQLDRIMNVFLKRCFDVDVGLIRSGYTIDWGDVSRDYPDQRALKLNAQSKVSYNLFYQARTLRAVRIIEQFARKTENNRLSAKWKEFYAKLKQRVREKFLLKKKSYLAIRYLPSGLPPLEREILAVGGICEAIFAGVLSQNEQKAFFNELFCRQKELKLFSGSFVLLPPYPNDYFPHHLLRRPYSYQNGGLWDWIGARLLKALYGAGYRQEAARFQKEMVNRTLCELTFWEWYDLEGKGRGAFSYTASAGELFRVILEQKRGAFVGI